MNATAVDDLRPEHPAGRPLAALAREFAFRRHGSLDGVEVTGLSIDTGTTRPGDLFVAAPGRHSHGAGFLPQARDAGAAAVLTDDAGVAAAAACGLPALVTADPRAAAGEVAAWIYRTREDPLTTLAVTGTNGKTSVVYLLSAILTRLGVANGLSSTAERRAGRARVVSRLTTPEAGELHALLARMREEGLRAAAVEVSAQALRQHRVDGIVFDVAGFTNLSHEHFEEFRSMDDYFAAKLALFQPERSRRAVVVVDTPWGRKLARQARIPVTTVSSRPDAEARWHVTVVRESLAGTAVRVTGPEGRAVEASIPLPGAHMGVDAAVAIVMLSEAGFDVAALSRGPAGDDEIPVRIPGRLERISGAGGPTMFLDFAHTPEAFRATLAGLRRVTPGRLISVFGGAGDRDTTKRPEIGAAAARGSDVVIVTDHDPRTEDPAVIRTALVDGARQAVPQIELYEIPDVHAAVRKAVALAGPGDVILYAGPGHKEYREVAGEHIPYSARDDSRAALRAAGWAA